MSTNQPMSMQVYDHRGMPETPIWDRAHLVDKVINAFAAAGTLLDRDSVDLHLLETVDKAACSLLRDMWTDGFPVAAYSELLATTAALRSILGYSPTPTGREVQDWARSVRDDSHEKIMGQHADLYEVQIIEGPHRGIVLPLWGPKTPQAPDALAGPPLTLELPTERGDSSAMEYGTAYYRRLKQPWARSTAPKWGFWLDRERPFPEEGTRPCFLPAQVGA
ncbi:hypothetical protein [Streptomyces sp. CL12-4]|uniref:hypothetical protein n=1 Tax=Streptomyces sp. CL12-4 TaxID=2810306 RepID=UPI001EFB85F2|nr:hypothetical protein [Streptomyces sp. CL12-4]MCG8971782.1 hypothetical protein [Streptomyces sp. CL12-4]